MLHVTQIYPATRVELIAELYYIVELSKYSFYMRGEPLSVDGVVFSDALALSELSGYLVYAIDEGWILNASHNIPREYRAVMSTAQVFNKMFVESEQEYVKYAMLGAPAKSVIAFTEVTDEYYYLGASNEKRSYVNLLSLSHDRGDQAWLSLAARVAVLRVMHERDYALYLRIDKNLLGTEVFNFSYLLLLLEETSCFGGWLVVTLDLHAEEQLQMGYYSWYAKGRDLGKVGRWYSPTQKLSFLNDMDIIPGDMVLLYERQMGQKINKILSVKDCNLARVVEVTKDRVKLELILMPLPYAHSKKAFLSTSAEIQAMYMEKPYKSLSLREVTIDLRDLGVGHFLYSEKYFLLPLDGANDELTVWVGDMHLLLPHNDLFYWVLEDYEYPYNRERFLERYFSNFEPLRDKYLRGDIQGLSDFITTGLEGDNAE